MTGGDRTEADHVERAHSLVGGDRTTDLLSPSASTAPLDVAPGAASSNDSNGPEVPSPKRQYSEYAIAGIMSG